MGSKMLIDAAHAEETRVVVLKGKRIEEFDYESASRKQLKGNIYLAKVTRVEPSLQAAFVDYGGNRHGFLAFSEIHPDYYQIPVADREALLAEEEEDERLSKEAEDRDDEGITGDAAVSAKDKDKGAKAAAEEGSPEEANGAHDGDESDASSDAEEGPDAEENVDSVGVGDDDEDERPRRKAPRRRTYKIQEVIKRRQVILIQVVKEERGNKGAALTTYLSLAGRYCVLMPNTARGGGISRKITDTGDRKRLKDVAKNLDVAAGMGLIVRTAGAKRTKTEIKRDFDYLLRLWENIRDLTLSSTAPSLIYEEGNLIKRSIRDLYGREIDEVLVEGEMAHKEAKDFMKMLMPSHARNVKPYKEQRPLFSAHKVDAQLDGLFSPVVNLPSGGYLVINQTEALVSIDINSGRSTREHNIEDTALKTNLEAAEEISRQLRLRDLAGLVVIDFIDMDERRNNRSVERKLKDALSNDRARIQVGRISHFGLLEMSRQRMRQGMLENSTRPCPHCQGTGFVRSVSSCALSVLRAIEDYLLNKQADDLTVKCDGEIAFYVLNEKRDHLLSLESAYGISIFLENDGDMAPSECAIERVQSRSGVVKKPKPSVQIDTVLNGDDESAAVANEEVQETAQAAGDDEPKRKRRRRRGRRGGRRKDRGLETGTQEESSLDASSDAGIEAGAPDPENGLEADDAGEDAAEIEAPAPKRRGRSRKKTAEMAADSRSEAASEAGEDNPAEVSPDAGIETIAETTTGTAAASNASDAKETSDVNETSDADAAASETGDGEGKKPAKAAKKPRKPRKPRKKASEKKPADAAQDTSADPAGVAPAPVLEVVETPSQAPAEAVVSSSEPAQVAQSEEKPASTWNPPVEEKSPADAPRKRGWWSRK